MATDPLEDQLVCTSKELKEYFKDFKSHTIDLMKCTWQPTATKLEEITTSMQQIAQISEAAHDIAVQEQGSELQWMLAIIRRAWSYK